MAQVAKPAGADLAIVEALREELRSQIAPVNQAIGDLAQRVSALESGPTHRYTQAQKQAPRGVEAPISTLFGQEFTLSSARSSASEMPSGARAVCAQLWDEVKLRERVNKQNKGTGRKALLFVSGPLTRDKERVHGPSLYWDIKNALDSGLLNGAKLTTDQVSVFESVVAKCEETIDGRKQATAIEYARVETYEGATQAVKAWLKANMS